MAEQWGVPPWTIRRDASIAWYQRWLAYQEEKTKAEEIARKRLEHR